MKFTGKRFLAALAGVLALGSIQWASADPVVSVHSSNAAITAFDFSFDSATDTITINQTWGAGGNGSLQFSGLDALTTYVVVHNITNNTGTPWSRIASELLDPSGDPQDVDDPSPLPAFVPPGFSTSNDSDQLTFDQGGSTPRISNAFGSVDADESSDVRDFLDFFDGTVTNGQTFILSYGLSDFDPDANEPFLLLERPNVASTGTPNPVPLPPSAYMGLTGLAALAAVRSRRLLGLFLS